MRVISVELLDGCNVSSRGSDYAVTLAVGRKIVGVYVFSDIWLALTYETSTSVRELLDSQTTHTSPWSIVGAVEAYVFRLWLLVTCCLKNLVSMWAK
jgi:hypothetical protein